MKNIAYTVFTMALLGVSIPCNVQAADCPPSVVTFACDKLKTEGVDAPQILNNAFPTVSEAKAGELYDRYLGDEPGVDHAGRKAAVIRLVGMMNSASSPEEFSAVVKMLYSMPDLRRPRLVPGSSLRCQPVPPAQITKTEARSTMNWYSAEPMEIRVDSRSVEFYNQVLFPVTLRFFEKCGAVIVTGTREVPVVEERGNLMLRGINHKGLNERDNYTLLHFYTLENPKLIDTVRPGDKVQVRVYYCGISKAYTSFDGKTDFKLQAELNGDMMDGGNKSGSIKTVPVKFGDNPFYDRMLNTCTYMICKGNVIGNGFKFRFSCDAWKNANPGNLRLNIDLTRTKKR